MSRSRFCSRCPSGCWIGNNNWLQGKKSLEKRKKKKSLEKLPVAGRGQMKRPLWGKYRPFECWVYRSDLKYSKVGGEVSNM